MNRRSLAVLSLLILATNAALAEPAKQASTSTGESRPFRMGTTRWPPDLTIKAGEMVDKFLYAHADLVAVHLDNGVPWVEALDNKKFSPALMLESGYVTPIGKKLLVSITPMNLDRSGLAPYYGSQGGMALPEKWKDLPLNAPEVKQAYLNYARRVVKSMKPDYLAIAIEANIMIGKNPQKWQQFKDLERSTYAGLKKEYPSLPVFFTIDLLHLLGYMDKEDPKKQQEEVNSLMSTNDVVALSVYPFICPTLTQPFPPGLLDAALKFKKPIGITESGYNSKSVTIKSTPLPGSEADQVKWIEYLLAEASKHKYLFVVNFASTDYEALVAKLPESMRDLSMIWAYTGLQKSDGKPKPALQVWDKVLANKTK